MNNIGRTPLRRRFQRWSFPPCWKSFKKWLGVGSVGLFSFREIIVVLNKSVYTNLGIDGRADLTSLDTSCPIPRCSVSFSGYSTSGIESLVLTSLVEFWRKEFRRWCTIVEQNCRLWSRTESFLYIRSFNSRLIRGKNSYYDSVGLSPTFSYHWPIWWWLNVIYNWVKISRYWVVTNAPFERLDVARLVEDFQFLLLTAV